MKYMLAWSLVCLVGIAALFTYPTLAAGAGADGQMTGPVFLVPFGYLAILIGACGLFLTWSVRTETATVRDA